jgi:hypothetical protein
LDPTRCRRVPSRVIWCRENALSVPHHAAPCRLLGAKSSIFLILPGCFEPEGRGSESLPACQSDFSASASRMLRAERALAVARGRLSRLGLRSGLRGWSRSLRSEPAQLSSAVDGGSRLPRECSSAWRRGREVSGAESLPACQSLQGVGCARARAPGLRPEGLEDGSFSSRSPVKLFCLGSVLRLLRLSVSPSTETMGSPIPRRCCNVPPRSRSFPRSRWRGGPCSA